MQLRHFVFANFIPATGDVIQRYIEQLIANSHKMTAVGALGFIVTALLLMYAIDSGLNTIWRSKRKRPMVYSFAVYWMILTLGPLLAGASLAISSYLLSLQWVTGFNGVIDDMLRLFPLLLSWIAFWLLYSIVPTTHVPHRHALTGAFVAALLFELGKKRVCPVHYHVSLLPADLWRTGCYPYLVPVDLLDMVYFLLGAEITVTLGEYQKRTSPTENADEKS